MLLIYYLTLNHDELFYDCVNIAKLRLFVSLNIELFLQKKVYDTFLNIYLHNDVNFHHYIIHILNNIYLLIVLLLLISLYFYAQFLLIFLIHYENTFLILVNQPLFFLQF